MDVLSLLRLITRHWRVTAPAALLTLVGLVAVVKVSAPTYNATGSIVLLNPREAPDLENDPAVEAQTEVGQNPFTRYGDIAIMTDILTRIMNSDSKREELGPRGALDYDIVTSSFQHDPIFEVTGHGPDPATAMRSTEIVLDEAATVLSDVQVAQGADPDYLISSAHLEPPSTATATYGSTMRAAIAVLAVGGLGTLGLAVLAEILGQRRAASRSASRRDRVEADPDDRDPDDRDPDDRDPDGRDLDSADDAVKGPGSNGSARRRVDADAADDAVEARGSNGAALPDEVDAEDEPVVEPTGSNGSARRRVDADSDGEALGAETNGSAESADSAEPPDSSAVSTSARSRTAGRGLGMPPASRSFNSAGIVPDGSPRTAAREGRNGSPAWGRATAPLGRRPHRRSQPDGSNGPPPDDQRDRSKPDR
jgi:hypothetical protein